MLTHRQLLLLEDLLKGLFLGLCHALVVRASTPQDLLFVSGSALAVVLMGLWLEKRRRNSRPGAKRGNLLVATIVGVLDYPTTTACCLVAGWGLGIAAGPGFTLMNLPALGIGLVAGGFMHGIRKATAVWLRRSLAIGLVAVVALLIWLGAARDWTPILGPAAITSMALVLSGIGFHLLAFAVRAEETELEIAIPCLALSLALGTLNLPPMARGAVIILPLGLFVVYCERIRKHLVVFKHVLRGIGHEQQGNLRDGLWHYRQALAVEPNAELAVAGNWRIHKQIDPALLTQDRDLLEMVDPLVCLSRAQELLRGSQISPQSIEEATKLLEIVSFRRPDLPITVGLEQLRLLLAAGEPSEAKQLLDKLSDRRPLETLSLPGHEADALFQAWLLGVRDPRLIAAGSLEVLEEAGRLLDLLAVLSRRQEDLPEDPEMLQLKPFLYDKLDLDSFESYLARYPEDRLAWLDYRYCWEVARSAASEGRHPRRVEELLRIAAYGLPEHHLVLWSTIARVIEPIAKDEAIAWHQRVKEQGRAAGPSQLPSSELDAFYSSVRYLADVALAKGESLQAIENLEIYSRSPKSGLDTLRVLKELYESTGQTVFAIRPVEAALAYSLGDRQQKEWAAEKARLYRAVPVADVQSKVREIEGYFDFGYCYRRAKSAFDAGGDAASVTHDLELAALGGKEYLLAVNYLLGRCHWQEGDTEAAVACWEAVRSARPDRFHDKDQEEAYFQSCRWLGDVYLETWNQPEKAIECYAIYKDYVKSGADTLFKLASAYERTGQAAHARKWYDMVLVYPSHPKASLAREALTRLAAP